MVTKRGDMYIYKGKIEVVQAKTTDKQNGKVFGRFVDIRTGEPIQYGSVLLVGTKTGTTINKKGEFEIETTGEVTLRFSSVGHTEMDKSFSISSRQEIEVLVHLGTTIIHEKKEKTTANTH